MFTQLQAALPVVQVVHTEKSVNAMTTGTRAFAINVEGNKHVRDHRMCFYLFYIRLPLASPATQEGVFHACTVKPTRLVRT